MLKGKKLRALNMELDGANNYTICNEIGISEVTLIKWRKEEEYKKEYADRAEEMLRDTMDKIKGATKKAFERLQELTESPNERIALAACNSLLDRGIGKARERIEINADVQQRPLQNISDEQLKKLVDEDE